MTTRDVASPKAPTAPRQPVERDPEPKSPPSNDVERDPDVSTDRQTQPWIKDK